MQTRALGKQGLRVSMLGLGCMGMSEFYGPLDDAESVATIHRAVDLGITFFDTADIYGPFTNERLVGFASLLGDFSSKALGIHEHITRLDSEKGLIIVTTSNRTLVFGSRLSGWEEFE